MINFVFDDGGRIKAGFKGHGAGDCHVRSLCIATGLGYRKVYEHIAKTFKKHGYPQSGDAQTVGRARKGKRNPRKIQDDIMGNFGLEKVKLGKGTRPTYTEAYEEFGNCVVTTTGHICTIRDNALRDTFDGRTYEWEFETKERKARSIWIPN